MDFLTDTDDKDDFVVPQRTLQGNKNQARQNVRGGLTSLFVTGDDVPSGDETRNPAMILYIEPQGKTWLFLKVTGNKFITQYSY